MNGALNFEDYKNLIKNKEIISVNYNESRIQPSSMDLTLSNECYELKFSFLSPKGKIRNKLKKLSIKKYNLQDGLVFKKNHTYLVRLNEKLNFKSQIIGKCNPKSSTGRLDIFCRTILDNSNEYEKIPLKYKGEIGLISSVLKYPILFSLFDVCIMKILFIN